MQEGLLTATSRRVKRSLHHSRHVLEEDLKNSLPSTVAELTEADLTLAAEATFERFDRFDDLYKPAGSAALRTLLLKHVNGQCRRNRRTGVCEPTPGHYYAELLRNHMARLPPGEVKEMRISIKGADPREWEVLADWVVGERLFFPNLRWVVQVPRNYREFREDKLEAARAATRQPRAQAILAVPAERPLFSYEDLLRNIFEPLFAVTLDPAADPTLHALLTGNYRWGAVRSSVGDNPAVWSQCQCDGVWGGDSVCHAPEHVATSWAASGA
jgi:AMP deaminase